MNTVREINYETNIMHFPPQQKLKKDGTPKQICCNKKKGQKSEVYAFEVDDMKKIISYFDDKEMYIHELMFILGCNLARRIGDMLSLRWKNFYNPATGKFRQDILAIQEDKTDKLANPHINSAVRNAINSYIEKTGCNPKENGYENPVFLQLTGNFKGRILSDSGYRKALKKAAAEVGIEYNVGTHSQRKSFGATSRMLHPNDYNGMQTLQNIFNHSSEKITSNYIGLTKKSSDAYYDDMGNFFDEYVTGDKEYKDTANNPIVSLDTNDLRDLIRIAYEAGKNNAENTDVMVHIDAITEIMNMIEVLQK